MGLSCSGIKCSLSLSRDDTLALKGVAILAMILHHTASPGALPFGAEFSSFCQIIGEVCISIFLFLSGYGLCATYPHRKGTFSFVTKRLWKFYLNYWCIFIIFVPVMIIAGHTPAEVYGGEWWKIVLEWFGLSNGYNPHWWFNKVILAFYLVFPLLIYVVKRAPIASAVASVFIYLLHLSQIDCLEWLPSFIWGMSFYCALDKYSDNLDIRLLIAVSLILVALGLVQSYHPVLPYLKGHRAFPVLSLGIVTSYMAFKYFIGRESRFLGFLGKHSSNMYFSHLFLYGYWMPALPLLSYWPVTFVYVVAISAAFSFGLEYLKKKAGVYKLSNVF